MPRLNIRLVIPIICFLMGFCIAVYYKVILKQNDDMNVVVIPRPNHIPTNDFNSHLNTSRKKSVFDKNHVEYIIETHQLKDKVVMEYVFTKDFKIFRGSQKSNCKPKERSVCISNNQGRMGNKMFQYSLLYGITRHLGIIPELDSYLYDYYTRYFDINATYIRSVNVTAQCTKENGYNSVFDSHHSSFDRSSVTRITNPSACHIRLRGFYQSWMYFFEFIDEMQREFTFKPEFIKQAQETLSTLTKPFKKPGQTTYVGIHVRRGDISSLRLVGHGHITPPEHYFQEAMLYFTYRYNNVVFVVATDSKEWCNKTFTKIAQKKRLSVVISNEKRPYTDMALLVQCNHTIMSVGTFGLWISMLTNGEVVYYPESSKPGSGHGSGYTLHKRDYYMPYWTKLF